MKKVFIDTSVLLSASRSIYGASYLLLALCRKKIIQGYISKTVIFEAKKNSDKVLDEKGKNRLNAHLLRSNFVILDKPTDTSLAFWCKIIRQKDAHVLACAHSAKVDHIVTLDDADFFKKEVRDAIYPVKISRPSDLVR